MNVYIVSCYSSNNYGDVWDWTAGVYYSEEKAKAVESFIKEKCKRLKSEYEIKVKEDFNNCRLFYFANKKYITLKEVYIEELELDKEYE
jgi:hypothetical protein